MDDASLEEFVDASGDSEDDRSESSESASGEGRPARGEDERSESSESASGTGSDGNEGDAGDEPDGVTPAASTYAWSGDGAECVSCGESTDRRWRDGDDLVCADCKEW
ncbi:hypothetical protein BV210_10775 [Halorientalis sp. IM1011]|uniref:DUF7573 domain-containing protein n=1 Tax=Halorientalis sp. IM1011 TaxID=1932360 RepID=UPI00097CD144|nr:hypothetical protein [Halorientalis sp. IM1011]AQL43170.1 hypothetical protein BV210_10775 [Halorientalis sp. IM1011]